MGSRLTGDCLRPLLQSHHSGLMRPQKAGPLNDRGNSFYETCLVTAERGILIDNDIDLKTTGRDGLPEIPSYVHHSSQLTGVDSANVLLLMSDIISMRNPIIQYNFMRTG